ncbi:MAG: phage tail protein [Burkholderiaceae bacterium]|jgi:phage protein U|nr:phage tail protein [Burkholderiaceae bacterium]
MFALLGDVEFDLITYFDGLETQFAADYAEQALIGRKPRLQFTGDKLDQVQIALVFHNQYCEPELEMIRLLDVLQSHAVLPLVFGNGDYKGRFVLTDLKTTGKQTDTYGTLLAVEANMTLKEFTGEAVLPLPPAVEGGTGSGTPPVQASSFTATAGNSPATRMTNSILNGRSVMRGVSSITSTIRVIRSLSLRDPLAALTRIMSLRKNVTDILPMLGTVKDQLLKNQSIASVASDIQKATNGMSITQSGMASVASGLSGANAGNLTSTVNALSKAADSIDGTGKNVLTSLSRMTARVVARML